VDQTPSDLRMVSLTANFLMQNHCGISLFSVILGILIFSISGSVAHAGSWMALSPNLRNDPALVIYSERATPTIIDETDDWSVECNTAILASITIADVDGDGGQDILVGTYGLPPNPYWSGYLRIYDALGNPLPGWPQNFAGPVAGSPAVGDIDNDGDAEVVVGTWIELHAFEAGGTEMPGWPISANVSQPVALYDLDGDGDLEIIVPVEQSMRIYHHDGTAFPGWPQTVSQSLTGAAIADLDHDDEPEIIAGTFVASGSPTGEIYAWHSDGSVVDGWPYQTSGSVKAPPAVGDVDGDGDPEVVVPAWNQSSGSEDPLYVLDADGQNEPGWPRVASYTRLSSPALGDLDGDGAMEIVIGGMQSTPTFQDEVFVFRGDGSNFPGWPVTLDLSPAGNINSSPIIGDIDDDDAPEIVVKVINNIVAFDTNGDILSGFPIFLDDAGNSGTFSPSPAVGDFDHDDDVDLVAAACYSTISFWDFPGRYYPESALWTQSRHDSLNTGSAIIDTSTSVVDQSPKPFWNGSQHYLTLYPNPASAGVSLSLPTDVHAPVQGSLFNILGQHVASFDIVPNAAGISSISWKDRHLTPGVYFLKVNTNNRFLVQRIIIRP
jgi:hypothetical protein